MLVESLELVESLGLVVSLELVVSLALVVSLGLVVRGWSDPSVGKPRGFGGRWRG